MKNVKPFMLSAIVTGMILFISCSPKTAKTESFKVWGNCGMCKETIESSLKSDGILKVNWDKKTKMMEVKYDTLKLSLSDIHNKIAAVGYDTEMVKGDDEAYSNLHECCQYERKE